MSRSRSSPIISTCARTRSASGRGARSGPTVPHSSCSIWSRTRGCRRSLDSGSILQRELGLIGGQAELPGPVFGLGRVTITRHLHPRFALERQTRAARRTGRRSHTVAFGQAVGSLHRSPPRRPKLHGPGWAAMSGEMRPAGLATERALHPRRTPCGAKRGGVTQGRNEMEEPGTARLAAPAREPRRERRSHPRVRERPQTMPPRDRAASALARRSLI